MHLKILTLKLVPQEQNWGFQLQFLALQTSTHQHQVRFGCGGSDPIYSQEPITTLCQCLQLKIELIKNFKKSISEILPPGIKSFRGCNSVTTGFCLVNFPQLHKMNKRNKIHKNEPNLSWELSPPAYCHKTWFFKTRTMLTKQLN